MPQSRLRIARLAELRASIELSQYDPGSALDSLIAGMGLAASAYPARARDLLVQAAEVAVASADAPAAGRLAERAMAIPGDVGAVAVALARGVEGALAGARASSPLAEEAIQRALQLEGRRGPWLGLAVALSGGIDLASETLAAALRLLAAEVARLRRAGTVGPLPGALGRLAWMELWADRHQASQTDALEGLALAGELGQPWAGRGCAMTLAMLSAVRGREAECAALIELLLAGPGARGAALHAGAAAWAAGTLDLGAGRFGSALVHLSGMAPGWWALWSRPDAVEAAVRSGRPGEARAALAELERAASAGWPARARALVARCRGLLASGREAEHHFRSALALHAEESYPFQEARTRLLWGEHLRRARRRQEAREHLRWAMRAFASLEARPWAVRAEAELRATGETVRRGPATRERLTPQEARIASLVAEGSSNRAIAERLFLSPRTVGYHLAKIYQKLGVSTRTQLARLLLEASPVSTWTDGPPGSPARPATGRRP